mgnify:CR=1 FL=1
MVQGGPARSLDHKFLISTFLSGLLLQFLKFVESRWNSGTFCKFSLAKLKSLLSKYIAILFYWFGMRRYSNNPWWNINTFLLSEEFSNYNIKIHNDAQTYKPTNTQHHYLFIQMYKNSHLRILSILYGSSEKEVVI